MADGARAPLHSRRPPLQKRAAVAGTLDGGEYRPLGEGSKLLPAPPSRARDTSLNRQAPVGRIDRRNVEVVAHKKETVGCHPASQALQGRFAVFGRLGDN